MINFIKTLHKNGNLTWFKFGKSDISDWAASKAPDIFRQFLGCLILTTSTVLIISDCVHWLWCHHRSQIWAENKQTGPTFVWRVKVWGAIQRASSSFFPSVDRVVYYEFDPWLRLSMQSCSALKCLRKNVQRKWSGLGVAAQMNVKLQDRHFETWKEYQHPLQLLKCWETFLSVPLRDLKIAALLKTVQWCNESLTSNVRYAKLKSWKAFDFFCSCSQNFLITPRADQ